MNDDDIMKTIRRIPASTWQYIKEEDEEYGYEVEELDSETYKIFEDKRTERKFDYESMLLNLLKYLDQTGNVDFAILKDPELGRYWAKKKKEIELLKKKEAALEKLNRALTEEEKKLLGIKIK